MKTKIKILSLSFFFAIVLIITIAVINVLLYDEAGGDFFKILIFAPPTDKILIRIAIVLSFLGYGFVLSHQFTRRKFFEKELLAAESQYYNLIGNLPGLVYRCQNDENWTMKYISDVCLELTGYTAEDFIDNRKLSYNDVIHPDDRKYVWDTVQENVIKRSRYQLIYRIITKDGQEKWVWERGMAVYNNGSSIKWLEGFITDITLMKVAEDEIRKREENLEAILKVAPIGIGLVKERIFYKVNDYMCNLLEYTPEELICKSARIVYPSDAEYEFVGREKYRQIDERGTGIIETIWKKKNGELVDIQLSSTYLEPGDSSKGTIFTALDITEKKRSERLSRLLSQGFEQAFHSIIITDINGITEYVNKKFIESTGFSISEAIGMNQRLLKSGNHSENYFQELWDTINSGKEWDGEIMNVRKNGDLFWEHVVITPIKDEYGEITNFIAIKDDITEKKKAEEQLLKLSRIYSVLSNINQMIVRVRNRDVLFAETCRIAAEEGRFKLVWIALINEETAGLEVKSKSGTDNGFIDFVVNHYAKGQSDLPCCKVYNSGEKIIINNILSESLPEDYKKNALERGFKSCGIFPFKVKSKTIGIVNIYSDETNFFDELEVSLLNELSQDIAYSLEFLEQDEINKHIHQALVISEKKYKTLIEYANEGIIILRNQKILFANRKFLELTGYSFEELSSMTFVELIHSSDIEDVLTNHLKRLQNDGMSYLQEFRLIDREGKMKWIEINSVRIDWESEPAILSFCTDRTESKTAELALKENELLLTGVLSALPVGVWLLDSKGKIYSANESGKKIWGGARYVGIDRYDEYKGWWLATGEELKPEDWAAARAIKYGETSINEEIEIQSFDGKRKIILNSAIPLFDDLNRIKGAIIVNQDITYLKRIEAELKHLNRELEQRISERTKQLESTLEELKNEIEIRRKTQIELLKAREELIQALKKEKELNELKTRFISLVSHEYRTPLTVILSSSYLLSNYFKNQNESQFNSHLSKIQDSVQRMSQMLEGTLTMSKLDAGKLEVAIARINLIDLLKNSIDEIRFIDKGAHNFITKYSSDKIIINTDQFLLRQIILNLLSNAIKFSDEGTEIIVEVTKSINSTIVRVIDYGCGIPIEEHSHIFEPFHRAKNVVTRQGTGLGLALVKRYTDILGCEISFESELNKGTTFNLMIPE